MAAAMIVDLPDTTTTAVSKKLDELRQKIGAVTMGRVLTLIIAPDSEAMLEESIEAANGASHEHPSRVIVTMRGDPTPTNRDWTHSCGWPRRGCRGGRGAATVRIAGRPRRQRRHPFLLPDIPVVAWWPDIAPAVRPRTRWAGWQFGASPDATNGADPLSAIKSRLPGYTAGDTDLAWARITYWRALLTSAVDLPPHEPIESASFPVCRPNPRSTSWRAGWPAGSTARCAERSANSRSSWCAAARPSCSARPQEGVTATLSRTASRMPWFRWRAGKPASAWRRT